MAKQIKSILFDKTSDANNFACWLFLLFDGDRKFRDSNYECFECFGFESHPE